MLGIMAKLGRPSLYTNEIADEICQRIEAGESLRQICSLAHMPSRHAVDDWCQKDENFRGRLTRARETHADFMDERILELSNKVADGALDPNAARVAIQAFQWRASKLRPKVYGDKQVIEHEGTITLSKLIESSVAALPAPAQSLPVIEHDDADKV